MRFDTHSPWVSDSHSSRSSHVLLPPPMWSVQSHFVARLSFAVETVGEMVANLNISI